MKKTECRCPVCENEFTLRSTNSVEEMESMGIFFESEGEGEEERILQLCDNCFEMYTTLIDY